MMESLYYFLREIGVESLSLLWFPLLIWTVASISVFLFLKFKSDLNPLYQYHLRVATILALPLGLLTSFGLKLIPKTLAVAESFEPAFIIVQSPLIIQNEIAFDGTESLQLSWFDPMLIIGACCIMILLVAVVLSIRLIWAFVELNRLHAGLRMEALSDHFIYDGKAKIQVAFYNHPMVPFTYGWKTPVIVLPAHLIRDEAYMNMAIQHELVHIERGDYVLQLILSVIKSLFWFHPLVQYGNKEIELYREVSCDQAVITEKSISPKQYANMLFQMVPMSGAIKALAVSMAIPSSTLKKRISKMNTHNLYTSSLKKSTAFLLSLLAIIVVPIACSDLQNNKSVPIENVASTRLEILLPSISVNGQQIYDRNVNPEYVKLVKELRSKSDNYSTADNGFVFAAGKYGLFVLSGQSFEGAEKAGEIADDHISFSINGLRVEIESLTDILTDGTLPIWVRHFPEKIAVTYRQGGVSAQNLASGDYISKLIPDQTIDSGNDRLQPFVPALEEKTDDQVFIIVEEQPVLIGGLKHLQSKANYPISAKKAGIEGRVIVQFIVDKNGNVTKPIISRSLSPVLDREALRLVKEAKFRPGKQNNRPVNVQVSLPIFFRLKADDNTFIIVEKQPTLIGGMENLHNKIKYPERALKAGIEGKVIVEFVVDKEGVVNNPTITKSLGVGLDEEVLRVIREAKFTPGIQRGVPVNVQLSLPFKFKLAKRNTVTPGDKDSDKYKSPAKTALNNSSPPKIIKIVEPHLPEYAKNGTLKAQVDIRFLVGKTGDVEEATISQIRLYEKEGTSFEIVDALKDNVEEKMLEAALAWRFTPATSNGDQTKAIAAQTFKIGF